MKHLIIYCHPNPNSLNSLFKKVVVEHLLGNNHEVVVRDLYALSFNPVLSIEDMAGQRRGIVAEDVKQEQDFITWADCITFIHPIWWTGLPALMKGYINRVFSYGFAYRYDQGIQKGLLVGKKAVLVAQPQVSNLNFFDCAFVTDCFADTNMFRRGGQNPQPQARNCKAIGG